MATSRRAAAAHRLALNRLSRSQDWSQAAVLLAVLSVYWVVDSVVFLLEPGLFERAMFARTTGVLLGVGLAVGLSVRTAILLWQNRREAQRASVLAVCCGSAVLIAQSVLLYRYLPLAIWPMFAYIFLLARRGAPLDVGSVIKAPHRQG
jgi:hypothetical protein